MNLVKLPGDSKLKDNNKNIIYTNIKFNYVKQYKKDTKKISINGIYFK